MTNKPMLSVERELLVRAVKAIEKHHSSLSWEIAEELRGLLNKPTTQHQAEPVYQLRNTKLGFVWRDADFEAYASAAKLLDYERRIMYAEEPAPVAVEDIEAHAEKLFYTIYPDNKWWKADEDFKDRIREAAKLNGLKP